MALASVRQRTSKSTSRAHRSHGLRPAPAIAPCRRARRSSLAAFFAALRAARGSGSADPSEADSAPEDTSAMTSSSASDVSSRVPGTLSSASARSAFSEGPILRLVIAIASTIGDAASDMRGERRPPFRRRGVARSTSTLAGGTASASSSRPLRLLALRSLLHRLLHVVISSQSFSHFFRHVNGRPHTTHVLVGRLCGLRKPAIAIVRRCTLTHGARLMKDGAAVATASSSLRA